MLRLFLFASLIMLCGCQKKKPAEEPLKVSIGSLQMAIFNKLTTPLAPALITFGPLFIAIGVSGPFHLTSVIGALVTGIGVTILFIKIQILERKVDDLCRQKKGGEA